MGYVSCKNMLYLDFKCLCEKHSEVKRFKGKTEQSSQLSNFIKFAITHSPQKSLYHCICLIRAIYYNFCQKG